MNDDKKNDPRHELAGNEIVRLMLEQAFRADAELRTRLSALTSVVFGLSLLALQVDTPSNPTIALLAWVFLGSAVVASAVAAFLARKASNVGSGDSIKYWIGRQDDFPEAGLIHKIEVGVVYLTGVLLIAGVVLLVIFASQNLK
jgi:hypothetical protein